MVYGGPGGLEQNLEAMTTSGEAVQQSFPMMRDAGARRVELTERDLGVLEFILEMKFARVRDVFQKFFKTTLSAEEAKSEAWAKKRLHQLVQARFLRVTYSHLDSERYFTTTLKAYNALATTSPSRTMTKPARGFDHRTLLHDRLVIDFRLELELSLGEVHWISDRRLKSQAAADYGLNSANVPDGIYRMPNSDVVADRRAAQSSCPHCRRVGVWRDGVDLAHHPPADRARPRGYLHRSEV